MVRIAYVHTHSTRTRKGELLVSVYHDSTVCVQEKANIGTFVKETNLARIHTTHPSEYACFVFRKKMKRRLNHVRVAYVKSCALEFFGCHSGYGVLLLNKRSSVGFPATATAFRLEVERSCNQTYMLVKESHVVKLKLRHSTMASLISHCAVSGRQNNTIIFYLGLSR